MSRKIPSVPAGLEPQLRNFLSAVREAINGGTGSSAGGGVKTVVVDNGARQPSQPGGLPLSSAANPAYEIQFKSKAFWDDIGKLATAADTYTYTGLLFKPNDPEANKITWSEGTATKNGLQTWVIAAETAGVEWVEGVLYIYYVPGQDVLSTATSLLAAIEAGGRIIATYRGGTDLTTDSGRAFIDGDTILAGTIGANQLVVDTAVITTGAQIANAIITNAHIGELTIDYGQITDTLQSSNYSFDDHTGWRLNKDGGIVAHDIAIFDSSGHVVLQAGSPIDFANLGGATKPENNATVGAPAGTLVAGVSALTIATASTNFNASNDRNNAAITAPTIVATGEAVDHALQGNGSADISFEWSWSGNEGDIDGFQVFVYQSISSTAYTFGTSPKDETVYEIPASKRAFILFGVVPNLYYTFGVRAYRSVDKDIAASGVILSSLVKPSLAAENPYLPSANIAFDGNVTGTINGIPAANVNVWSSISGAGKPADGATVGAPSGTLVGGVSADTVVTNAGNGNAAFTGTANYRSAGAPTNNPTPSGLTITTNSNGTVNIRLDWSAYAQGAKQADMLMVFWRKDGAAPTINDSTVTVNVNTVSGSYYILEGVNPADTYSFGIAAARRTESGLEIGSIQAPTSGPDWRGVTGGTPNYTANINGMAAASLVAAAQNYLTSNDLKSTTPATPTFGALAGVLDYTTNTNGSIDISFEWLFTAYNGSNGDDKDIDGFFVYVHNNGASAPGSAVDLSAQQVQLFNVDASKRAIVLTGMSPDSYYTFGVQAYRVVDTSVSPTGLKVSAIAKPATTTTGEFTVGAWRASSSVAFAGDITGTINGTAATTVVANASSGSTAYAGTANYRNNSAPTNNAAFGTITQSQTVDGNVVVEVPYTYAQGAVPADQLFIFYREGGGTVLASDPSMATNAVSGSVKFVLKPGTTYRFALQAVRRTENGLTGTALLQGSNMTTSASNFTGNINSVAASVLTTAVTNFNAANDRNGAAITAPTIPTDGTAVDHTINTDSSADISFEWSWSGNEGDIDGFRVYLYQSTSSSSYAFGTTPAAETVYEVPASKRAFILFGTAANRYYTFGVQAYRSVDKDIAASGVILSTLVKVSRSEENPYRPESNIAFNGNVTGTINNIPAANVNVWSAISGTGKPADNATVGADWGVNVSNKPTSLAQINAVEGAKLSGITANATQNTIWYGPGVPSSGSGINGDFYIDTDTGITYSKSGGAWRRAIPQFTSANISTFIANTAIGSAQIGNAAIQTAHIGNAQVDTLQVKGGAITAPEAVNNETVYNFTSINGANGAVTSYSSLISLTPVTVDVEVTRIIQMEISFAIGSASHGDIRIDLMRNGTYIDGYIASVDASLIEGAGVTNHVCTFTNVTAAGASVTYSLRIRLVNGNAAGVKWSNSNPPSLFRRYIQCLTGKR
ncbi:beta strand repeat-containing protein [Methylomicrobium agile]|uniref:beta strand repeat-containing protein n=1 Tax=Methylomicrobium agile TaxID=39774 RepID=UPI00056A5D34|nr:hypothetical protein [Methylomicrobium agile]